MISFYEKIPNFTSIEYIFLIALFFLLNLYLNMINIIFYNMGVCPSGLRGLTQDQVDVVLGSSNLPAPKNNFIFY